MEITTERFEFSVELVVVSRPLGAVAAGQLMSGTSFRRRSGRLVLCGRFAMDFDEFVDEYPRRVRRVGPTPIGRAEQIAILEIEPKYAPIMLAPMTR